MKCMLIIISRYEGRKVKSDENHKVLIREIYRYRPDIQRQLELRKRVGRVEKFAPIFNKRLRKGITVDLGCGTGIYTKEIHSRTIVGIDFSLEGLTIAQEYCHHALFVLGDLEYLPFRENSIDSFFSFCSVYCLLPDSQHKLFKELYLMLRNNGNILLIEPNALNPLAEKEPKYSLHKSRVEKKLKEVGFKNIEIKFCDFIPRFVVERRGSTFKVFRVFEKFLEFLQIPISGTLMIYAEKDSQMKQ